jgi:hypothetical protein
MTVSLKRWILLLSGLLALAGCSLVDEDLTVCEAEYQLSYELRLVTNITTELETELSLDTEVAVATALKAYLDNIFTDRAHDVDLSFYDTEGEKPRQYHESHIMDANQTSYTLHIPVHKYLHLGLANLEGNGILTLEDSDTGTASHLQQQVADTLPTHKRGVFSARAHMDIKEGEDQRFNVNLYMANCAASLVLDTLGSNVKDIRVYAAGFATAFDVADSVYRFQHTPVIRADKIEVTEPGSEVCFATVNFPSRVPELKAVGSEETFWQFRVYCTLPDGTITETKLSVKRPLLPAKLDILKAKVYGNGALEPGDSTVGVDVNIDWSPGMEHEISM